MSLHYTTASAHCYVCTGLVSLLEDYLVSGYRSSHSPGLYTLTAWDRELSCTRRNFEHTGPGYGLTMGPTISFWYLMAARVLLPNLQRSVHPSMVCLHIHGRQSKPSSNSTFWCAILEELDCLYHLCRVWVLPHATSSDTDPAKYKTSAKKFSLKRWGGKNCQWLPTLPHCCLLAPVVIFNQTKAGETAETQVMF